MSNPGTAKGLRSQSASRAAKVNYYCVTCTAPINDDETRAYISTHFVAISETMVYNKFDDNESLGYGLIQSACMPIRNRSARIDFGLPMKSTVYFKQGFAVSSLAMRID